MSRYSRDYDSEFAKLVAEFGTPDFVWKYDHSFSFDEEDNHHAWWFAENKYIDNFGKRWSTTIKSGTIIHRCLEDVNPDSYARFIDVVQEAYKKWLAEQILLGEGVE